MRRLKFALEKPTLIWVLITFLYLAIFWTAQKESPPTGAEEATVRIIEQFGDTAFPPKIGIVRDLPDWGHVGFYAVMGRVHAATKGDLVKMRAACLAILLGALFVFSLIGYRVTYRNRLNPLWISLALIFMAANPHFWGAAFHVDGVGILLLFLMLAMYFFEADWIGWAALFVSLAVLVDFRALLLAASFLLTRVTGESSRLLRPERMLAFVLPFAVAILPLMGWGGVVPQGKAHEWFEQFLAEAPKIRPEGLFYAFCLIPLFAPVFSWAWGFRARSRALTVGAIATAVCTPIYFVFPIHFDWWDKVKLGDELPFGLVDQGAHLLAGPYKNLVLFVPWFIGAFLFFQILLMDVLDRSRWLRYFIIFFFCLLPFVGVSDREFLIVLPALFLLSLSEALVGEEGKLA